jgi:general L-amino acid transport system permease protein
MQNKVNTAISLMLGLATILLFVPFFNWLVINATFTGTSASTCSPDGACWPFINARIKQFMFGFFPDKELWRIYLSVAEVIAAIALFHIPFKKRKLKQVIIGACVFIIPISSFYLFVGGIAGLVEVPTVKWGGLHLTLIVAITGITASLPLGVLLALARTSTMPVLRFLSVVFIESWRGIPLISVLFMSSVMLPIFLPDSWQINKLLRALIGVTIFSSAYMAEVIRGGLQALPRGQYEAAHALGLGYWQTQIYIILPQALKNVIPGIVNNFIALFKDTTLVLIIGLFDLLGMIQMAINTPKWIAFALEGYIFAGAVYWIFCYSMSKYSMRLEKSIAH